MLAMKKNLLPSAEAVAENAVTAGTLLVGPMQTNIISEQQHVFGKPAITKEKALKVSSAPGDNPDNEPQQSIIGWNKAAAVAAGGAAFGVGVGAAFLGGALMQDHSDGSCDGSVMDEFEGGSWMDTCDTPNGPEPAEMREEMREDLQEQHGPEANRLDVHESEERMETLDGREVGEHHWAGEGRTCGTEAPGQGDAEQATWGDDENMTGGGHMEDMIEYFLG
mmetsp:Transcript_34748/g.92788  ORF Transcript_34748/g.92788 Transcript_34748/m.92788 type:complete len:222 (-) Transcript_34748:113-778(-)